MDYQHDSPTAKILWLYRKLAAALTEVTSAKAEADNGDGDAAAAGVVMRIRELGAELESLLDDDERAQDGDIGHRAARVRTIEREIADLLPRIHNLGRHGHGRGGGWAH